jgi:two-component system response regulator EvgA
MILAAALLIFKGHVMHNAKIIIVDEHKIVSSGIQSLLLMNGFCHISVANTIRDAIDAILARHYDIMIFDPEFADNSGIGFLRDLVRSKANLKTIIISESKNNHLIMQSISIGTNGYVSKKENVSTLISAIGCVYNSVDYLPGELVRRSHDYCDEQRRLALLTEREMLILKKLAKGKSNKLIADELGLNNKTVSTYKTKIFQKLDVNNIVDVVEMAKRNAVA